MGAKQRNKEKESIKKKQELEGLGEKVGNQLRDLRGGEDLGNKRDLEQD